jgi:hypothetical protein
VLNKGSIIICLYNNAWHCVHYDSKLQRPYLRSPQPNVHYYYNNIKLPTESNIDSDEEPPTKKPKSDPPSKEEVLEPLHKDFAIRYASIDASVLTQSYNHQPNNTATFQKNHYQHYKVLMYSGPIHNLQHYNVPNNNNNNNNNYQPR